MYKILRVPFLPLLSVPYVRPVIGIGASSEFVHKVFVRVTDCFVQTKTYTMPDDAKAELRQYKKRATSIIREMIEKVRSLLCIIGLLVAQAPRLRLRLRSNGRREPTRRRCLRSRRRMRCSRHS